MKTIEERAKEYSLKDFDGYYTGREKALEEGYLAGAKEQQKIDIDKACDEFCNRCTSYMEEIMGLQGCCKKGCDVINQFRKAMEE